MTNKLKIYAAAFTILSCPIMLHAGDVKGTAPELSLKQNIASASEIFTYWEKTQGDWIGNAKMIDTITGLTFDFRIEVSEKVKIIKGERHMTSIVKMTLPDGKVLPLEPTSFDRINADGLIETIDEGSGKIKEVETYYFANGRLIQLRKNKDDSIKSTFTEEIRNDGDGDVREATGFIIEQNSGKPLNIKNMIVIMRRKNKGDTPLPQSEDVIKLAEKYLQASGYTEKCKKLADDYSKSIANGYLKSTTTPQETKDAVVRIGDKINAIIRNEYMGSYLKNATHCAAETYTRDELAAAIAFYDSDLGKSLARKHTEFGTKADHQWTKTYLAIQEKINQALLDEINNTDKSKSAQESTNSSSNSNSPK